MILSATSTRTPGLPRVTPVRQKLPTDGATGSTPGRLTCLPDPSPQKRTHLTHILTSVCTETIRTSGTFLHSARGVLAASASEGRISMTRRMLWRYETTANVRPQERFTMQGSSEATDQQEQETARLLPYGGRIMSLYE